VSGTSDQSGDVVKLLAFIYIYILILSYLILSYKVSGTGDGDPSGDNCLVVSVYN
jgi:hypothetical protein